MYAGDEVYGDDVTSGISEEELFRGYRRSTRIVPAESREEELFRGLRSTRGRSPDHRRIIIEKRARARIRRRAIALLAFIDEHPTSTRATVPELARLDDLVGEADRLWRTL